MGSSEERDGTTRNAIKAINENLNRDGYNAALLHSFIYVNIRLRSLLTDYLSPTQPRWKETHSVLGSLQFPRLLKYCKDYRLIDESDKDKLDKLAHKRNNIAHESVLWRAPTPADIVNIEGHCQYAISFLRKTNV